MLRSSPNTSLAAGALAGAVAVFAGCGGGGYGSSTPPGPVAQNASVSGQYSLVLTSTNGHGTTNIYTNFTQAGTTFTGSSNTLVCPSNDLGQCEGADVAAALITASGTVGSTNISMTISFPSTAGTHTVTMVGTVTGPSSGTYTDSLGDSGTWTASAANPLVGNYLGTFNSTSNPLTIAPNISILFAQDASHNLTGTATLTNFPCIASLTLSGQAIGGAFTVTDAASKVHIVAVPAGNSLNFTYKFQSSAASCAGDFGAGVVAINDPWGY